MEKHETETDLRPARLTDGQGAVPFDPDEGLEPRVDFAARLHESLDAAVRGAKTSPAEQVAKRLGLPW